MQLLLYNQLKNHVCEIIKNYDTTLKYKSLGSHTNIVQWWLYNHDCVNDFTIKISWNMHVLPMYIIVQSLAHLWLGNTDGLPVMDIWSIDDLPVSFGHHLVYPDSTYIGLWVKSANNWLAVGVDGINQGSPCQSLSARQAGAMWGSQSSVSKISNGNCFLF